MMLQSILKSNIIYSLLRMFVENSFVSLKNFGRLRFQPKKERERDKMIILTLLNAGEFQKFNVVEIHDVTIILRLVQKSTHLFNQSKQAFRHHSDKYSMI